MNTVVWTLRRQLAEGLRWLRGEPTRKGGRQDDFGEAEVDQKQGLKVQPPNYPERKKVSRGQLQRRPDTSHKRAKAHAPRVNAESDPFSGTPPARAVHPLRVWENETLAERDIAALLVAAHSGRRQLVAQSIPEIREPQPYQSSFAREILRRYYLEGQKGADFGDLGLGQNAVSQLARKYLAEILYYRAHPENKGERVSNAFDPGWAAFDSARTELERRFAFRQHPELGAWLHRLGRRNRTILKLVYGEGMTLTGVAERLGVSKEVVRQSRNRAVRQLSFHDRELGLQARAERRREEILGALQAHPTLRGAAAATGETSQGFLEVLKRLQLTLSLATPGRLPQDDPRMLELLAANRVTQRRKIAQVHPELRPPYPFLSDMSNRLLERVVWQGQSYREAGVDSYLSLQAIKDSVERALETMHTYLRQQPPEYYRSRNPY